MARRGSYAKGIAKREEILTAALEVIARNGYGRASVRELADAVGLSQAGLLHYFSSKEELFAEVLRKRDEVDREVLEADHADDPDADEVSLLDGFVGVVRHNAEVPGLVQLYARLSNEATAPDHAAHAFFEERFRMFRELAADDIRAGQQRGEIPADLDAERLASILLAVSDGLQTQWLMDPSIDMAAHIEYLIGLFARPAAP
ncbi:TetR/AcrR family transcriptional regulator [Agromyces endophyticus]|uniref:TetR/AcrR family transcriptional regulator n=1 Tax=Agromyces sp. H17E-10 TaxID=2932244 RepID=UPI001FD38568|nr:TetR/AcrR family transcriptional regulator [Agromyces sp. H17E-10]UOQ90766.1 TetR/AcrR family transcriptional regulator [Agromyces sp. H17E-10]